MMRWRKLGLLYAPGGRNPKALSHAMGPTPFVVSNDLIRLYIAHLDEHSVGRIGYVEVKRSDPTRPVAVVEDPVLEIGPPGTFDDNGVVPSSVVQVGNQLRLYYVGFQLQRKIPYTMFSGLAVSEDAGRTFRRASNVPLLDRGHEELFIRSAPFVLEADGEWRMWYVCAWGWTHDLSGKIVPQYDVRHVASRDGVAWQSQSTACLAPQGPDEIGLGRPFVVRHNGEYRMWYSIRTRNGYGLGYAESADGLTWTRMDEKVGIACSSTGWDSEMICYAAIVPGPERWLMFYNGNGYGRTGVGVAATDPE